MPVGVPKSGKRKSSPRVDRVSFKCSICEAVREYVPSVRRQVSGKFCSKSCAMKGREKRALGKIKVTCSGCGVEAEKWPYAVKKDGPKYCTKACMYASNKSKFSYAEWSDKNRDRVNAKSREWRAKNPEKRQAIQAKRRAVEAGGASVSEIVALLHIACGVCVYCGLPCDKLQIDHVVPISAGGSSEIENLIPCCGKCNQSKNARDLAEWLEKKGYHEAHDRISDFKLKRSILAAQGVAILQT